jgi:hypothetical protein
MKRLVSRSLGLATMLLASQAFAFSAAVAPGSMPGVNAGSIPGVKVGSIPGVNVNGAVTLHGITVLPNGRLIVTALSHHAPATPVCKCSRRTAPASMGTARRNRRPGVGRDNRPTTSPQRHRSAADQPEIAESV